MIPTIRNVRPFLSLARIHLYLFLIHTARLSFYAIVRVCVCVLLLCLFVHTVLQFFRYFLLLFILCLLLLCFCVVCAFFCVCIACVFGWFILPYGLMTTTISVCDTQSQPCTLNASGLTDANVYNCMLCVPKYLKLCSHWNKTHEKKGQNIEKYTGIAETHKKKFIIK